MAAKVIILNCSNLSYTVNNKIKHIHFCFYALNSADVPSIFPKNNSDYLLKIMLKNKGSRNSQYLPEKQWIFNASMSRNYSCPLL